MFKIKAMIANTLRVFAYGDRQSFAFRELAYIDVVVELDGALERMVMPFYRSAGINSGKKEGQWYPILGLKETTGPFHEFTRGINRMGNGLLGGAKQGWLVKNLFFEKSKFDHFNSQEHGYSQTSLTPMLKQIADELFTLYEAGQYHRCQPVTDSHLKSYNEWLYSEAVAPEGTGKYSQVKLMHAYYLQIMRDLGYDL